MTTAGPPEHSPSLSWIDFGWAALIAGVWAGLLTLNSPTLYTGLDYPRFFGPFAEFLRSNLLNGELPWWNPYASLGRPFLADLQSAALYPTTAINLVFGVTIGVAISTLLHGMLALLGFARLTRGHGAKGMAVWVGGAVLLFSAPWLARMHSGNTNPVFGLCYLPLVLDLSRRLTLAPNRKTWTSLSMVLALQLLSSHPQPFWLSVVGASAYALGSSCTHSWRSAATLFCRSIALLAGACLTALGLLGVVLVPLAGLIAESNRAEPSMEFSAMFAMAPNQWLSLLLAPSESFAVNWEYDVRIGFTGVTGGLLALRRWRDPAMRGWILMGGLGVLIAAGNSTPAFTVLYHALPGFSGFRIPARAGVLLVVALIAAATTLAGRVRANECDSTKSILPYLIISCGALALLGWNFTPQASTGWLVGQVALLAGSVAGWYLWEHQTTRVAGLILPTMIVIELTLATLGQKALPPQPGQFTRFDTEDIVVAAIDAKKLNENIAPPRVSLPPGLIRENSGLIHSYASVTGYESLSLVRVWTYLHRAARVDPKHAFNTSPAGSVYDVVPQLDSVNLAVSLPPKTSILEVNPHPDPRVYLVGHTERVPHWSIAVERMIAGHPIHHVALIEESTAMGRELETIASDGSAVITHFSLNRVEIEVASPGSGLLVLKEAWYPGWAATVDGVNQACIPVNAWMRGVRVPAGSSQVVLSYHQPGLWSGICISLLTAAGLAWVRRRKTDFHFDSFFRPKSNQPLDDPRP